MRNGTELRRDRGRRTRPNDSSLTQSENQLGQKPRTNLRLVAAGRRVDADIRALSAIRVIGPCIAMGAAAAHALDLAGTGSVHAIDHAILQRRLSDNLDRRD